MAMGGVAFDALACGPDALAGNPAALARPCESPRRLILLPTVGIEALDNGAGGEVWRHRRQLRDALDEESFIDAFGSDEFERILGAIPGEGWVHRVRTHLPVVQTAVGQRSALSLSVSLESRGSIARDLAELALRGHEEGRTSYRLEGTSQETTGYWTLAFGRGGRLMGTDVGVTARLIGGGAFSRWHAVDPVVDEAEELVTGLMVGASPGERFVGLSPSDGWGWGMDVGLMRDLGPARLGLALQNVVGTMSWPEETLLRIMTLEGTVDGLEFSSEDEMYDPATMLPPDPRAQVAEALRESPQFPRRLRASATMAPLPMLVLAAGADVVMGDGNLDRGWDRRFSLGSELRPLRFLRFHGGLSSDLDGASEVAGGLELDLLRFRLGVAGARVAEAGREAGWKSMEGWRLVAGISRF